MLVSQGSFWDDSRKAYVHFSINGGGLSVGDKSSNLVKVEDWDARMRILDAVNALESALSQAVV